MNIQKSHSPPKYIKKLNAAIVTMMLRSDGDDDASDGDGDAMIRYSDSNINAMMHYDVMMMELRYDWL